MSDPAETVQQILDSGRRFRFGKGVVSKTTYVVVAIVAIWAVVAWRLGDNQITNLCLLIAALIPTLLGVWFVHATQKYAAKNPAQAMLEGAELLEWRKLENAASGVGVIPKTESVTGRIDGPKK